MTFSEWDNCDSEEKWGEYCSVCTELRLRSEREKELQAQVNNLLLQLGEITQENRDLRIKLAEIKCERDNLQRR
jgi:hypothetical protein